MVPNELLTKSFSMFVFVICLLFLFAYTFCPSSLYIGYFYFWYWFWFYLVTCMPFFVYISWYFNLLTFHCFLPANLICDRVPLILIRRFISCVHSIQRSPYVFLYPGCPLSFLVSCGILFSVLFRRKKYEKETLYIRLKFFSVRYELDTSKLKCVDRYIHKFFTFNGLKDILSFASLTQDHILL